MDNLKISTAQFENRSNDKKYNLSVIESLTEKAAHEGSQVIAFHECSITGYSFARHLSKKQLLEVAEYIPESDSIKKLIEIAAKYDMSILAGLFEKDEEDQIFKAHVCIDKNGISHLFSCSSREDCSIFITIIFCTHMY